MSAFNVLMFNPQQGEPMSIQQNRTTQRQLDDHFSNEIDHQIGQTIHCLAGDVKNLMDLASDPRNRELLIKEYRIISEIHKDFTTAIEMMWRPR